MQSVMNFCGWTRASGTATSANPLPGAQETLGSGAFGWLIGYRRLLRDYELLPQTSETFIYLAIIRIMVRRLVT